MSYLVPNEDDTTKYTLYINSDGKVVANPNSACLFESFQNLTEIENLEYLDTSNVTDMSYMFYECSNLTTLDLSNVDASIITNEKIFSVMPAAITIIVKDKAAQDALLAHPDKKSTWTIDNIIIKG